MAAEVCGVGRAAGHDDFDRAAVHIVAVPFGAQSDDLVIQIHAHAAAHRHHHRLARGNAVALLEMGDQIGGQIAQAGIRAENLLAQAQLRAGFVFVAVDFIQEGAAFFFLEMQADLPRLIHNRHGCAVFHRVL